jgi:hypothetical protein
MVMNYIDAYFSTPSPVPDPAGKRSGAIDWGQLWQVVDTVDKIAQGFQQGSPFNVNIKESRNPTPIYGDVAPDQIATIQSGFGARLWGTSGNINIYSRFWEQGFGGEASS